MNFKSIAIAVALSVAASAALADDQNIVLASTGPGSFAGAFTSTRDMSGAFVDTFTFSLPTGFSGLLGSGSVNFESKSGPVSLVVATLDAANGVSVASPPDADQIAFPSTLNYANGMAPFTLTLLGFAGDPFAAPVPLSAGYSGSISFVQTVPEPETYALMLAGLAAVGSAARRRKSKRIVQTV